MEDTTKLVGYNTDPRAAQSKEGWMAHDVPLILILEGIKHF